MIDNRHTHLDTSPEQPYSRVRKNFLHLLKGRGVSAVLSLATTAIMARALSPADFGLVIMIHAYVLTVIGLVNLKPFEAIVRYGIEAQETSDPDKIHQLLRITLVLDLAISVGGTLLAMALVPVLAPVFEWQATTAFLVVVYCLFMLSSATGTASGILRLFNRFDLLGIRQGLGPFIQLVGVLLAWWSGGGYGWFLFAFGFGWCLQNLLMMVFGLHVCRQQLPGSIFRGPVWQQHRERFPGLWQFLHVVYWQSNLDLIPKKVAVLAVGSLLGTSSAGLFHLAQQFAKVLTVPALLVRQVMFPDLVRLWHRADPEFGRLLGRILWLSLALGAGVSLLSLLVGKPLIALLVGRDYLGMMSVLVWLMLAAGMDLGVSGLRAACYAMGLAGLLLRIHALSLVIYGVLFLGLGSWLGLAGTGMATAVWSALILSVVHIHIRKRMINEHG
jgi:O-antigen/teichoic acid export membrane protein